MYTLKWVRDRDGYRIEHVSPSRTKARQARLLGNEGYDVISRNGGPLVETQPPFKKDGLWRCLADIPKTPEGALGFVSTHGFLYRANAKSERVDEILEAIEIARRLVTLYDRRDWNRIAEWLDEAGRDSLFGIGGIGRLGIVFDIEPNAERPALRFRPGSLMGAILVQFLNDAAGGAMLRSCAKPDCSEWFRYGPGTKHRDTAKYCSPTCQKAHAYMKRKGRSK